MGKWNCDTTGDTIRKVKYLYGDDLILIDGLIHIVKESWQNVLKKLMRNLTRCIGK